jgi:putative membrane protein
LDFGLWCIPILLAFIFFVIGLEVVDTAVEEPFGTDLDDLPLERYCQTISDSVDEIFGPVLGANFSEKNVRANLPKPN